MPLASIHTPLLNPKSAFSFLVPAGLTPFQSTSAASARVSPSLVNVVPSTPYLANSRPLSE